MSSSSLAATTLVASSSNGSNSTGHTSPSVSSMEEDPNLSGSEASFDPNNQQTQSQQPQQPQQLKSQPSHARTPGKHADVELDAANMLSSLKHVSPTGVTPSIIDRANHRSIHLFLSSQAMTKTYD